MTSGPYFIPCVMVSNISTLKLNKMPGAFWVNARLFCIVFVNEHFLKKIQLRSLLKQYFRIDYNYLRNGTCIKAGGHEIVECIYVDVICFYPCNVVLFVARDRCLQLKLNVPESLK